eukprot:749092-Hanusia_phi.AAC.2
MRSNTFLPIAPESLRLPLGVRGWLVQSQEDRFERLGVTCEFRSIRPPGRVKGQELAERQPLRPFQDENTCSTTRPRMGEAAMDS